MEQTSKTPLIIGIVAIAAIIGVVISYFLQTPENMNLPVAKNPPTQTKNGKDINISQDTSDAALDQDFTNIDKQISGLDQDSSAVAEALNAPAEPQQ